MTGLGGCAPHISWMSHGTKGLVGLLLPGLQGAGMLAALQGCSLYRQERLCSLKLTATR